MPYGQQEYSATKTLTKFLLGFIGGGVAVPVVTGIPDDFTSFQETWPLYVIPLASGLFQAGRNVWKNKEKIGINLGFMIAVLAIPVFALSACETLPFQNVTETTITYPDGRVETIVSTEFDQAAWDRIMAGALELQAQAQAYRERQAELDAEERAQEEAELTRRAEILRQLIEAARSGNP